MHLAFIPYGEKTHVDYLLDQMRCQKFPLIWKQPNHPDPNKRQGVVWIAGNLRYLPSGVIDYVFPMQSRDRVLTSLGLDKPHHYQGYKMGLNPILMVLRKALGYKPIPKKFNSKENLIWIKDDVNIIPVGIKEDIVEWNDPNGTIHEAI